MAGFEVKESAIFFETACFFGENVVKLEQVWKEEAI